MDGKNKLYFGDNLKILRDYVEDASVDLIYLDPPFNSSATYDVLFKRDVAQGPLSGPAAFQVFPAAQIAAFEASVAQLYERRRRRSQTGATARGLESEGVYREIVESGPRKLADLMQVLPTFPGRNEAMAHLTTQRYGWPGFSGYDSWTI